MKVFGWQIVTASSNTHFWLLQKYHPRPKLPNLVETLVSFILYHMLGIHVQQNVITIYYIRKHKGQIKTSHFISAFLCFLLLYI